MGDVGGQVAEDRELPRRQLLQSEPKEKGGRGLSRMLPLRLESQWERAVAEPSRGDDGLIWAPTLHGDCTNRPRGRSAPRCFAQPSLLRRESGQACTAR